MTIAFFIMCGINALTIYHWGKTIAQWKKSNEEWYALCQRLINDNRP